MKDEVHKGSTLEQPGLVGKSSKKKKDTAALAREIKWGEDAPNDVEAKDASLPEMDGARPATTPSRRAAGMSSAPTSGTVTTEYEVNPFLSS